MSTTHAGTQIGSLARRHVPLTVATALCAVTASAVGYLGFSIGSSRSGVHVGEASCLSAPATITCTLNDGWDIEVSTSVSWTDSEGTRRFKGRPECLPPTGRGAEGPIRLYWVTLDRDGLGTREAVHVTCR